MRWSLLFALVGCLPADGRPTPGQLLVEVDRAEDAVGGFTTDDGWTVEFDRFVTTLGGLGAGESERCVDYSFTGYQRIFDFVVAPRSKLHLHFGLGVCEPRYRFGPPTESALLMAGVSEADRWNMRDPRTTAEEYELDEREGGVGLWVVGRATNGELEKRFNWEIRTSGALIRCFVNEQPVEVHLRGGEENFLLAEIRPRELFRTVPSNDSPIAFDRFARADASGDGVITLSEVEAVSVDVEPIATALAAEAGVPKDLVTTALPDLNLERLVRSVLAPRVISFQGVDRCGFSNAITVSNPQL